ncbi:hypothetical protein CG736_33890 [Kitasatospora sp. CB02891]|nr:hypothetical protein CG736_33890 [Kitasatospora sp. CB02891]
MNRHGGGPAGWQDARQFGMTSEDFAELLGDRIPARRALSAVTTAPAGIRAGTRNRRGPEPVT